VNRLKKTQKIIFALLFLVSMVSAFADNVRHVVWNKTPIAIHVPIGHEKMITFPSRIQPFLPDDLLRQGALQSINNEGTLYLMANKPFSNKMAEIKLDDGNGDVILLNLFASKTANTDQIAVLLSKPQENMKNKTSSQVVSSQREDTSIGDRVRWVAQQLYAPKRLLTRPNWIVRTPMHTEQFVSLYRGAVVSAMPRSSWRSGDDYITAVLLRNVQKNQGVVLRHTMIRGNWIVVSFFRLSHLNPAVLTPARTVTDSTTAILVSSVPFDDALKEGYHRV